MTCIRCNHSSAKRFGTYGKRRVQRSRCNSCHATFADPATPKPLGNHCTSPEAASKAFALMLEGMSIRAISRRYRAAQNHDSFLARNGWRKCQKLWDSRIRGIRTQFVQADEIWTYVGCHHRRLPVSPVPSLREAM